MRKFRVRHQPTSAARSPYRVVEEPSGREVEWVNRFLDRECLRRVADLSLRTYAWALLHCLRWWDSVHHTPEITGNTLPESTLLEYVRFQSSQQPPLSGSTINERVATADRALRALFPAAPGQIASGFPVSYWRRAPMGLGRPIPALSRVRVNPPNAPSFLCRWRKWRASGPVSATRATSRSVGLMLLQELRSREVLDLNRDDVLLPEAQIRIHGKGNKRRILPLAPESVQLLDHYLRVERPNPASAALLVSLKGPARGRRMTPAGLRSLFHHHRKTTAVKIANPHRFRLTFASDMLRSGVSLPALMHLIGRAYIQTTLIYIQITPLDVYQQYGRAVAQLIRPVPQLPSGISPAMPPIEQPLRRSIRAGD